MNSFRNCCNVPCYLFFIPLVFRCFNLSNIWKNYHTWHGCFTCGYFCFAGVTWDIFCCVTNTNVKQKTKACTVESATFTWFSKHEARMSTDTPSPVEEMQGHHSLYYYLFCQHSQTIKSFTYSHRVLSSFFHQIVLGRNLRSYIFKSE